MDTKKQNYSFDIFARHVTVECREFFDFPFQRLALTSRIPVLLFIPDTFHRIVLSRKISRY